MNPWKSLVLFLLLVPAPALIHAKDKKPYKLPAAFTHARYVYVEAVDGQEFDPRLYPDDRKAIADVAAAVYNWPRYTLVTHREDADLIFVVRKGRQLSADVGVEVDRRSATAPNRAPKNSGTDASEGGPNASTGVGVHAGGQAGPPDDLLEIYEPNPGGHYHGTLLWQHTLAHGLDAPDLTLFKQLKDQVERDYPNQNASNSTKP